MSSASSIAEKLLQGQLWTDCVELANGIVAAAPGDTLAQKLVNISATASDGSKRPVYSDLTEAINLSRGRKGTIAYRRLSRSRLQARYVVDTKKDGKFPLCLMFESTSLGSPHWQLCRASMGYGEEEEQYWRPWQPCLESAEEEYEYHKESDQEQNWHWDDIIKLRHSLSRALSISTTSDKHYDSSSLSALSDLSSGFTTATEEALLSPEVPKVETMHCEVIAEDSDEEYWSRYDDEVDVF